MIATAVGLVVVVVVLTVVAAVLIVTVTATAISTTVDEGGRDGRRIDDDESTTDVGCCSAKTVRRSEFGLSGWEKTEREGRKEETLELGVELEEGREDREGKEGPLDFLCPFPSASRPSAAYFCAFMPASSSGSFTSHTHTHTHSTNMRQHQGQSFIAPKLPKALLDQVEGKSQPRHRPSPSTVPITTTPKRLPHLTTPSCSRRIIQTTQPAHAQRPPQARASAEGESEGEKEQRSDSGEKGKRRKRETVTPCTTIQNAW